MECTEVLSNLNMKAAFFYSFITSERDTKNTMKQLIRFVFMLMAFLLIPIAGFQAQAATSTLNQLRWTSRNDGNPPFVRIAMDLSKAVNAEAAIDKGGTNFEVVLHNTKKGSAVQGQYNMDPRAIKFATVSQQGSDTYLDVALSKPQKIKNIRVFALKPDAKQKKPQRLVVDIPIQGARQTVTKASMKAKSQSQTSYAKAPAIQNYSVTEADRKALSGKIICIDPGHGGSDVGAVGHINGSSIYEKNITLSIALPLRDMLTSAGAKVIMTRSTDKDVYAAWDDAVTELQARCDVANKAGADAFVSIHIDSFSNPSVDGTTAYYYPKNSKDLLLAQMLHQACLESLSIPDRGVRSNDFYVNVHTDMPSVLMEMGFITNYDRVRMLTSSWAPKSIARCLFEGLVHYFQQVG
jgi:N-acetylmuramoyl-L-alanine amidase